MIGSVRVKLTAWYVLVFGSLLVLFSIFVYEAFSRSLYRRLDDGLTSTAATAASVLSDEIGEDDGTLEGGARETVDEMKFPQTSLAIIWKGKVIASNSSDAGALNLPSSLAVAPNRPPLATTISSSRGPEFRVALCAVPAKDGTCYVVAAQSLVALKEQLASIRRLLYVGLVAAIVVASIGGLLLAKKSLAPVVAMSSQAQRISARNLHERLLVANRSDELGTLAAVFNELLQRLDSSFENMRRFMADASHELRTPLAIIRGEADIALSQHRDTEEYREALAIVQDEARRLSRIVDDLLELARADAGQRPIRKREFYLNDLVEECSRSLQVLANSKGVILSTEPCEDVLLCGDEDIIRRMLMNLLDNAIKFTGTAGSVVIKLIPATGTVKMVVADTGVGIPSQAVPEIFGRFFRVDRARSRSEGGSGLGLAIAKWAAEAHDGSIEVRSEPGKGSSFIVTFPLPQSPDQA
ncbi:MAG TPA: ATP-binding protein [Blastocatellia bacterium]|nr:ATP-binding protein [Blastocatellia bacterium]